MESLAIPRSVKRLILHRCSLGRLELPEHKTSDVLFLENIAMRILLKGCTHHIFTYGAGSDGGGYDDVEISTE